MRRIASFEMIERSNPHKFDANKLCLYENPTSRNKLACKRRKHRSYANMNCNVDSLPSIYCRVFDANLTPQTSSKAGREEYSGNCSSVSRLNNSIGNRDKQQNDLGRYLPNIRSVSVANDDCIDQSTSSNILLLELNSSHDRRNLEISNTIGNDTTDIVLEDKIVNFPVKRLSNTSIYAHRNISYTICQSLCKYIIIIALMKSVSSFEKSFDRMGLGQEDTFQPSFQSNFRGDVDNTYLKELEKAYRTSFEHIDGPDVDIKYGNVAVPDYSSEYNAYKGYSIGREYQTNYPQTPKIESHPHEQGGSMSGHGGIHGGRDHNHARLHKKQRGQSGGYRGGHTRQKASSHHDQQGHDESPNNPVNGLENSK